MSSPRIFRPPDVQLINPLEVNDQGLGNGDAPAIELPFNFAIQSKFNTTVKQYAILPQPKNEQIVVSTLKPKTLACYAVAAPPDNECPVAIQFYANGMRSKSGIFRLTPGQLIRPHGLVATGKDGSAGGFDFGLPFGWLGGGRGRLIVFKTADSLLTYVSQAKGCEVLFHQVALPIQAADGTVEENWPKSFPWTNAASQLDSTGTATATAVDQSGTGILTVKPTKTVYELVCNAGGAFTAATVNALVHRDGAAVPFQSYITFPSTTGAFNSIVTLIGDPIDQGAGDESFLVLQSGDATLQTYFVNIYRYGVLG